MIKLGRLGFLKNRKGDETRKTVIKIPSAAEYIKRTSSKILKALEPYKVKADTLFDIRLSVEEAVRNAMVHGNHGDKGLSVRVAYWIKDSRMSVEVEDEGSGFDHARLADPTADENITKGSGRGVFLIKSLMDEVEFNESGNRIKMTKYIQGGDYGGKDRK